ncbi:hypothetical protein PQ125_002646 [Salmonella enterica]|nr:hypothetical protein [Salmonella enterica]
MKVAMFERQMVGGSGYFINYAGTFYFWSPGAKRWYRAISQASSIVNYRYAINNGRVKWVKLKVMRGIDGF